LNWFAVYTNPRAEKKVNAEFIYQGIESYLPLQRTLRFWSDRRKWVEEPLFKSYIFVHISENQYFHVLNTTGVVRYVTFEGRAVPIPEKQIEAIRYFLSETDAPQEKMDLQGFEQGMNVEITRGPLKGLTGQIVNHPGQQRVRVEIEALGQFLNLTISPRDLRVLS
jgi:transcription antitermination factor NusG